MALALLDLLGLDGSRARLRIDTGTNRYYQVILGRARGQREGFAWIDDEVQRTPVRVNPVSGVLESATEITVPVRGLLGAPLYAQLFSYKTTDRRGLGFSPVLALERALTMPGAGYVDPQSLTAPLMSGGPAPFAPARAAPCRTCAEQFSAPRLDDLLGQIVRVAGPVLTALLGSGQPAAGAGAGASGPGTGTPGAGGAPATTGGAPATSGGVPASAGGGAEALGPLLQALVGALPGLFGALTGGGVSHTQSLLTPDAPPEHNRFVNGQALSRPMVFGIDDAIIGSVIGQVAGPLLQVLPQLLNSANQTRVQLQQDRNHLVSQLVGDVERRMLLQQVLQAQQQAPSAQSADLGRLADLLQQAGAAPAAGAAAPAAAPGTAATTVAQSLSDALSTRAVASFVTAAPIPYAGQPQVVFAAGRAVTLQVKLAVTDPVPVHPLPKAIVRVLVKHPADQRVLAEKTVKRHDLAANTTVPVAFSAQELSGVPAGETVALLAEVRWRVGAEGAERRALGSQDAVFVPQRFVTARGADTGVERELTDMARFRSFWNKVWESPTLGEGKIVWGLKATMRFTVLLSAEHPSNGLMETRRSAPADAADDPVREQTAGRIKAGVECSVDELAKLAALWDGEPTLEGDHLAAFRTAAFARSNGGELVTDLRLDGHRDQRGMVWVVPVFRLVDHTLAAITATDENGQVTTTTEEHARLPLPVAVRILELVSGEVDAGEAGDGPPYRFDGYRIEHSDKVALTPHG